MRPSLAKALRDADGLLFLCSGNMIRSAFAELYARHIECALPVRSAGTTYANPAIHPEARRALADRGVPTHWSSEFRPQQLEDLSPAAGGGELILCMTREHREDAVAQGARGPAFLLMEALGERCEIADPYFEGGYAGAFASIDRCVVALARAAGRGV